MRNYRRMVSAIRRQGPLALALMVTAIVVLFLAFGHGAGPPAFADGDGKVSGTATVVIGSPLSCTLSGALTGGSTIEDAKGFDVAFVTDSLSGGGQCTGNPAFAMTGSITGTMFEQKNNVPGVLEFSPESPGFGTFQVMLEIDSEALQIIHNKSGQPMMMDCPNITNGDLFSCALRDSTTVDLYNAAEDTVLATITAVDLDFEELGVGGIAEVPEVEDRSLQSDDSSGTSAGVLAGIAAGAAAGVVVLGGGAWYARKIWLRRPR